MTSSIVSFELERLLAIVDRAPIGVILLDTRDDHGVRRVSTGMAAMLGYTQEELSGIRLRGLRHPDDTGVSSLVAEMRAGLCEHFQTECRYRHRDGHYLWFLVTAAMLRDADGRPLYLLGHLADITASKRQAEQLHRSEQLHRTLTSNLPKTTVALIDRDLRVLAIEGDGERMLEHRRAVGRGARSLTEATHLSETQRAALVRRVRAALDGAHQEYDTDLGESVFHATVSPLLDADGLPYAAVIVSRDVTDEREIQRQLRELASVDSVTGLPNRNAFREELDAMFADGAPARAALIFLDVDNFKSVNDSLGHDAGDELLRLVGERVRSCVRDDDGLYRLSGDEFTLLLRDACDTEQAAVIAQRILDAIALPVLLSGHEVFPSASLGIAMASAARGDSSELLKAADMAMYAAKRDGRNTFRFFHHGMATAAEEQLRLTSELHRAVEREELVLHFQPQLALPDERIESFEALVRWAHPRRGLLMPCDFVPLAEESGLIVPIGAWVLREACRQLAAWRAAGAPGLRVAVNVAAAQLDAPDLVATVRDALVAAELPASALELEITETSLLSGQRAEPVLRALKRMGVRLAVDDFGTGYSSLSRLRSLPIDVLKVDRSFVSDVPDSPGADAIARSIIGLAHNLGISALAEGVETATQLRYLVAQGCDAASGWLWDRALPPEEITARIHRG